MEQCLVVFRYCGQFRGQDAHHVVPESRRHKGCQMTKAAHDDDDGGGGGDGGGNYNMMMLNRRIPFFCWLPFLRSKECLPNNDFIWPQNPTSSSRSEVWLGH
jgi:hypothetical protein